MEEGEISEAREVEDALAWHPPPGEDGEDAGKFGAPGRERKHVNDVVPRSRKHEDIRTG